jgi:hypothetical protein
MNAKYGLVFVSRLMPASQRVCRSMEKGEAHLEAVALRLVASSRCSDATATCGLHKRAWEAPGGISAAFDTINITNTTPAAPPPPSLVLAVRRHYNIGNSPFVARHLRTGRYTDRVSW